MASVGTRAVLRLAAASCAAVLVATVSILGAVPAAAAEQDLGWLRLTPASGTIDVALDVLSEKPCPEGESVVAEVDGPGIPTDRPLGNLLGNTLLTTLPETESGQLYAPMQFTLRDWFGQNVPGLVPGGTYTISLICRDKVKSSLTYGAFTAQVKLAKNGTYEALGEAAKPFNTTKASTDPVTGEVIKPPSASAAPGASASASAPAGAGGGSPVAEPTAPAVVETPAGAPAPAAGTDTAAVAIADESSSTRTTLVLIGAGLLAAALLASSLGRRRRAAQAAAAVDDAPAPHDHVHQA